MKFELLMEYTEDLIDALITLDNEELLDANTFLKIIKKVGDYFDNCCILASTDGEKKVFLELVEYFESEIAELNIMKNDSERNKLLIEIGNMFERLNFN